jgi:hypothetical protein
MDFKQAAAQILESSGRPLHYREITVVALEKGMLGTVGKTPWATMNAQLNQDIKKKGEHSLFESLGKGIFTLRQNRKVKIQPSHSSPAKQNGKYFIFVVNDIRKEGYFLSAREVYDKLMATAIWGINERTPNRRELLAGTKIIFYQAGKGGQAFIGTAEISDSIYKLSEEEIARRKLQSVLFDGEYAIHLKNIISWKQPKPIQDLVGRLDFIKREKIYGVYLQGGVRKIDASDYQKIIDYHPPKRLPAKETKKSKFKHVDIEGMLIELGNLLGFDTYCADKSKTYNGTPLSELTSLKTIPKFSMTRIINTAQRIDVIWFEDDFPVFAFEVEHTTDITKGLLRLHQLTQFQTRLFIVSSKEMQKKFDIEISKTPFYQFQDRYDFRTYQELNSFYTLAKRYHIKKGSFLG